MRGSDHLTMLNVFSSFEESGANASWCDANSLQFKILSRAKEIRGRFLISNLKRVHPLLCFEPDLPYCYLLSYTCNTRQSAEHVEAVQPQKEQSRERRLCHLLLLRRSGRRFEVLGERLLRTRG